MKFKSALVIIFLFILNIYVSSDVLEKEFKSQAYIVGEYVNLREKPTVKSKSIALLLDGTSCYCEKVTTSKEKLGKFENYWYYLNIGGTPISGWIYGQFVKFRDNDDEIVFNKEKYYKLFDRSIYPQSFNQIINKRWSDIKPGVKFDGERGGDEVVFKIEKNIIYLPRDYIENPIYLIEKITEVSKNKFIIVGRLVHADFPILKKEELYRKFNLTFNEKENTITLDKELLYKR